MKKWLYRILGLVAFIVIIALVMLIPPVSDKVGTMVGKSGAWIRGIAQTVAGLGVGVLLVICGALIGASLPIIAGAMVIAGLGMLAWNLYPLFKSSSTIG